MARGMTKLKKLTIAVNQLAIEGADLESAAKTGLLYRIEGLIAPTKKTEVIKDLQELSLLGNLHEDIKFELKLILEELQKEESHSESAQSSDEKRD